MRPGERKMVPDLKNITKAIFDPGSAFWVICYTFFGLTILDLGPFNCFLVEGFLSKS